MALGEPYVRVRTTSDYWLYASLFATTCPVAFVNEEVAGAIVAFRSQDNPDDVLRTSWSTPTTDAAG
jgi:hypothetical protein